MINSFKLHGHLLLEDRQFSIDMSLCELLVDYHQLNINDILSDNEWVQYDGFLPKRQQSYLLGRYALKQALNAPSVPYRHIDIQTGVFGQPVFTAPFVKHGSLAHSQQWAIALVSPNLTPVSIDFEVVELKHQPLLFKQFGLTEHDASLGLSALQNGYLYWTFSEALSKALLAGLVVDIALLRPDQIWHEEGKLYLRSSHFPHVKGVAFMYKQLIGTVVIPAPCQFAFNDLIFNLEEQEVHHGFN